MLSSIIKFSLTQRLFVTIVYLALMAYGVLSWFSIPIDAFPDISPTQVKIILKAPGMTPEEIESQLTRPIETELLGIPSQSMLRSTTKYAITDITLDFEEGTDIYWARQQVNERLSSIWDSLPKNTSGGVAPMSTPLSEMFMFTIENPSLSLMERRLLLDWEIRPILRTVTGVADVNILGGYARSFTITPDPAAMASAKISFSELKAAISLNNRNDGAGKMEIGNDTIIVRSEGMIDDLAELKSLVIKVDGNKAYHLSDISKIEIGHLTRYGAVTKDGVETTEALVVALKNANTANVVADVKKKLQDIQSSLPDGTVINVFYDRSNLIETAIETISIALFEAVLLVIILLAIFLGNLRSAFVVSLSLPMAALMTFILMNQFNLSANLMSLGGLVIAIGMLVDSSVVVVENIVNQIAKNKHMPRLHLIYRASKDVAVPVVSGTLIVIIVFSPLLTLTGLEGKLFTPVALTIVFAMVSALILSLTVIPVLASYLVNSDSSKEPSYIIRLKDNYQKSLLLLLAKPKVFITSALVVLIASVLLFSQIGKTFMPTLDEGDIIVQLEKTPGISLNASIKLDAQIEKELLLQIPEIKQIVARTGADELGLDPMSLNETDVFMELLPADEWRFDNKEQLINAIRNVLHQFPGINFGFTQPIQMRVSEMLTGSTGDVAIKIFGNDISQLAHLAEVITEIVSNTEGSIDVQTSLIEGGRFLNIVLKPEIAQKYGLNVTEFGEYLKTQFEGLTVTQIIQGKRKTPVMLSQTADKIVSIAQLKEQLLVMPDHSLMTLESIANIKYKDGPLIIEREKGNRFSVVTANVEGRDVVGYVEELNQKIEDDVTFPNGYSVTFGGEFENQQRATLNLLTVVPIALAIVTIILFTTFNSLAKAGLILANVPFALMGGIIALYISGEYLSVPASVGFIALLGIAVLNGVVMVSYFEQIKLSVKDLHERIIKGSTRRLRPILMTATTAMFGLFPLVFATGPGAEIQKPLAIVVIGGLLTSTITTLYLLPLFYYRLENKKHAK